MLLLPLGLNFVHDYPLFRSILEPVVLISLGFHLLIWSSTIYLLKRLGVSSGENAFWNRMVVFGIIWFYFSLVMECGIIPMDDLLLEHRMYLPAFGFLVAVVSLIYIVARKYNFDTLAVDVFFVVVILVFSTLTILRNEQWRDPLVFWQDALSKSPNKHRIHGYIGNVYCERGNMAGALREYREMLAHDFRYGQDHYGLGEELLKNGYYTEAVEEYLVALKIRPDKTFVYERLAEAYHLLGDDSRAEDARRKAAAGNKLIGNEQGVW
jgi:tetratricopeptide (TPR) repeat protein